MRIAVIAGQGRLPAALAQSMPEPPLVAALDGFAPDGLTVDLRFRVERLVPFLRALERDGIDQVIFAGAVTRPRLDPALLDEATAALLPRLMGAMAQGDDATLRVVIDLFEEYGFDSLDQVELIVAFEEHMGFDIPNEDAENNIRTLDDAVHIFSKELLSKNEEIKKQQE